MGTIKQQTRYIAQVKGSNGSGKTTIARQLIALSKDNHLLVGSNSGKVLATVLDDVGWTVIGKYEAGSKMGGCDGINSVKGVKVAILTALKHSPTHNILFEGMMISTIKSTFYDFLLGIHATSGGAIIPRFVILAATPEGCINRIQGRGTMKPGLKEANIISKCDQVIRHAREYNPEYVRWLYVEAVDESAMLLEFLRLLGYKEE